MVNFGNDLLSLEQFLRLPEYRPPLEFVGGRVIQKMSPQVPHGYIQLGLARKLDDHALPRGLGRVIPELRCTFGGQSQVSDVAFFVQDRIPIFVRRRKAVDVLYPPDIVVEILSHGQTLGELGLKIRHSLRHGARLGWLIHPIREELYVLRPGRKAVRLRSGDTLSGDDVLPDFSLPIDELFGWLGPPRIPKSSEVIVGSLPDG